MSEQPKDGAVAYVPQDRWQPIETAPKDGTEVLMYHPDLGMAVWPSEVLAERSAKGWRNGAARVIHMIEVQE